MSSIGPTSPPAASNRQSWRAVAAAVSVNLAGVLPLFLTGAMAVQIRAEFDLGPGEAGLLLATFAAASLISSAPLGRQVGRIGISPSLRGAAMVSALALGLASLAPNPVWLTVALGIAGLGNSIGQTSSNALIAARVPDRRFGIAYAIKQSAIPLSILLGGLAVPAIALTVGWRGSYLAALLIAGLAVALVPAKVLPAQGRSESAIPKRDVPANWLLALGVGLAAMAAVSIGAHAASSAVSVGFSQATAGLLIAVGGAAGLTVRILAGIRADRVPGRALVAAAVLMFLGGLGWLLMSSLWPWLFVIGLLMANGLGWGWPGLVHLAVARRFPLSTAAASGVTQTGVATGLLLGPPVIGFVAGVGGWGWAWLMAAVAAGAGALVTILARRLLKPRSGRHGGPKSRDYSP